MVMTDPVSTTGYAMGGRAISFAVFAALPMDFRESSVPDGFWS
jgi:hypothetical protein